MSGQEARGNASVTEVLAAVRRLEVAADERHRPVAEGPVAEEDAAPGDGERRVILGFVPPTGEHEETQAEDPAPRDAEALAAALQSHESLPSDESPAETAEIFSPPVAPDASPDTDAAAQGHATLLDPRVADECGEVFAELKESVAASRHVRQLPRIGGELTLEDLVRELTHDLLKEWLDRNLYGLVERLVRDRIGHSGPS